MPCHEIFKGVEIMVTYMQTVIIHITFITQTLTILKESKIGLKSVTLRRI